MSWSCFGIVGLYFKKCRNFNDVLTLPQFNYFNGTIIFIKMTLNIDFEINFNYY